MPVKLKCPKLDCVWVTDQESEDSLAMNHLVMHVQAEHHIKVKPMEKSAVKQLRKMDKSVAPTIKAEGVDKDKASAQGKASVKQHREMGKYPSVTWVATTKARSVNQFEAPWGDKMVELEMERPKVQDMEGSVTCPMRDCGWEIYWKLDERLTKSPYPLRNSSKWGGRLVYLDMHQQKEHSSQGNEANIEELLVSEAQMKGIVDEAPNKDMSAMVPTVKQHITTATQMEEGNSKQGQMVWSGQSSLTPATVR